MKDFLYVQGIANWAKLFERNRDQGEFSTETDGMTTLDLVMDQENYQLFSASGSRLKAKPTEDGMLVKFKRPWVHPKFDNYGGPPQVVTEEDGDIVEWDTDVSIGNGSLVEVAFSVYDTGKGKGTRLEAVKVLDLVPYETENEGKRKLPYE